MKALLCALALAASLSCQKTTKPPVVETADQVIAFSAENQEEWTSEGFITEGAEQWQGETLRLPTGEELAGVRWTGELPQIPYTIRYEARRLDGVDFFGALTFPVRSSGECVTWIPGGWGGGVIGISSINGRDASENQSTQYGFFEDETWYQFEISVTDTKLTIAIDGLPHKFKVEGEELDYLPLEGLKLALRPGPIEPCAPLGFASWQGACEIRNVIWQSLGEE